MQGKIVFGIEIRMPVPILIVDDSPLNAKLLRVILSAEGYDIHSAASAEEVLAVLPKVRPRLILMDLQLPGMDGLELTRKLKSDPQTRDTLIVAVTASVMKGDEERALAAGCDDYLMKPVDTRTLPQRVAEILAQGGTT